MNLRAWLYKKFCTILEKQKISSNNPANLATSFCLGVYIAFSPFIGFHAISAVVFSLLFKLNMPLVVLGMFVNNPWTMIPIYGADYGVGYYMTHTILGLDFNFTISLQQLYGIGYYIMHTMLGLNFSWIVAPKQFFMNGEICLLSFLIGGNVLGILAAIISYPIFLKFFKNYLKRKGNTSS